MVVAPRTDPMALGWVASWVRKPLPLPQDTERPGAPVGPQRQRRRLL